MPRLRFLPLILVAALVLHACTLPATGQDGKKGPPIPGKTPIPKVIVNSIGMRLVRIDPATYSMGSPREEPGRLNREYQHEVELTTGYYIGAFEVTQDQYRKVMGENPSYFSQTGDGRDRIGNVDPKDFPVERVAWEEALAFCVRLSTKENRQRIYDLPTEAEWEYACRARSATPYSFGRMITLNQVNFNGEQPIAAPMPGPGGPPMGPGKGGMPIPGGMTGKSQGKGVNPPPVAPPPMGRPPADHPVKIGSYASNPWGLYDMHGNVAEWCKDWYDKDYYRNSADKDPKGPSSGNNRVIRGGSFADNALICRTAYRGEGPTGGRNYIGFRVIARIPPPMEEAPKEKTDDSQP